MTCPSTPARPVVPFLLGILLMSCATNVAGPLSGKGLSIRCPDIQTLTGSLTFPEGGAVDTLPVLALFDHGGIPIVVGAATDTDGTFQMPLPLAPSGPVTLILNAGEYPWLTRANALAHFQEDTLVIPDGVFAIPDYPLRRNHRAIDGLVLAADSAPLAGVFVAVDAGTFSTAAMVDRKGRFHAGPFPPGDIGLRVRQPNGLFGPTTTVTVLADSVVHVTLIADRMVPSCRGLEPEPNGSTIYGAVVDSATGFRLPFAFVNINAATPSASTRLIADSMGCFVLSSAASRRISLTASSVGYFPTTLPLLLDTVSSVVVISLASQPLEVIEDRFALTGSVTGQVLEAGSLVQVANAVVFFSREPGQYSGPVRFRTDDKGYFNIPAISAGDYFVSAFCSDRMGITRISVGRDGTTPVKVHVN